MHSQGAMTISRVVELPQGFEVLIEAARAEGFVFLERLRDEWRSGENRFDRPGEAFFVARRGDRLAGVCGLNRDPYANDPGLGRLRRLYVPANLRRRGAARALVARALSQARGQFTRVRIRTHDPEAERFYRALGFEPVLSCATATHELALGSPAVNPKSQA